MPLLPAALVVAFAGLFAAAVLGAAHVLDLPVPCGRSRGCTAVATHPSSSVFGVPIAFAGVAAYAGMILLLLRAAQARWARQGLLGMAGLGAVASAVLLHHSKTVIGATCAWCVASGVAMALLFGLSFVLVGRGRTLRPSPPILVWALALVTSAAIGLQAGWMQRQAHRPPIPAERLASTGALVLADASKSLGPADAPLTIVVFADLFCTACRAAHGPLVQYQRTHPKGVRLVYRHLPLWNIRGHESSGAAAALGELAAEQDRFWEYVEALHQRRTPPDREAFLELAQLLGLDPEEAEARVADEQDPAVVRVWKDVQLADSLGVTATPTFVLFLEGHPPISANQRTLPLVLNSPAVLAKLWQAAKGSS